VTALLRPQPVGVLPLPAGGLLLPDVPGAADVVAAVARGIVPTICPDGLAFYALALNGDVDGALALIAGADDPVLRLDAFVIDPSPERYFALRTELTGELRVLLDAAAFTAGLLDQAPDAVDVDGELLAVVLLTQAADALEHRTSSEAAALLELAVDAARPVLPALAAQLLGTLADLEPQDAPRRYAEALALLPTGAQTQVRAELLYGRGVALQSTADGRAGVLKEAVRCYQQALVVFRRDTHPQLFAEAQTNLALCHLATPMVEAGDALRLGIAVQALRDALTVWDRESFPLQWASVTLNLANALQYLPSTHQQDNLAEAVDHYEELLAVRDPTVDPLGCARVLANQGNALAHLGITDHAHDKLVAAQQLFAAAGDNRSADAVVATLVELEAVRLLAQESA
jgi:tetratricopeptide (TPR) repeat protein